jgi:uncharacterized membrane protein YeaQ/YmgE (transglycosylase-associated protein family)
MSHHHHEEPAAMLVPRVEVELAALNIAAVNGVVSAVLVHFLLGPYRSNSKQSCMMQLVAVALGAFALNWLVGQCQSPTVLRVHGKHENSYMVYAVLPAAIACFVYFWVLPRVGAAIHTADKAESEAEAALPASK